MGISRTVLHRVLPGILSLGRRFSSGRFYEARALLKRALLFFSQTLQPTPTSDPRPSPPCLARSTRLEQRLPRGSRGVVEKGIKVRLRMVRLVCHSLSVFFCPAKSLVRSFNGLLLRSGSSFLHCNVCQIPSIALVSITKRPLPRVPQACTYQNRHFICALREPTHIQAK